MAIETIEKPVGSQRILVHLYRNKKSIITSLLKNANLNQRTTYTALRNLSKQQLIEVEISSGFPVRKYYKLTKKGKGIASHLAKVDSLLGK